MNKKYPEAKTESTTVAEPMAVYAVQNAYRTQASDTSAREHVMASTVSVDEYFDELISQIHADYANL